MTFSYAVQIDCRHVDVIHQPKNIMAVMGYDTGSSDVQWITSDWAEFPHSSHIHVDQTPSLMSYGHGVSDVADVEAFAGTIQNFINATKARVAAGRHGNLYCSYDALVGFKQQIYNAGLGNHVHYFVANFNWSETQAVEYLEANPDTIGVQFASPGSNPRTIVPGTNLTLAQAGCDLSIKRADLFPSPGIAALSWTE